MEFFPISSVLMGFKILSIFNPRESFHIPGLCRQLFVFEWAESSRRGGEAGCTRPTHSWRWSPFYAFHNSPILVTKSCHYLSQNGLNQASNSMKMVKNSPGIEPLNKKADVYQLLASLQSHPFYHGWGLSCTCLMTKLKSRGPMTKIQRATHLSAAWRKSTCPHVLHGAS